MARGQVLRFLWRQFPHLCNGDQLGSVQYSMRPGRGCGWWELGLVPSKGTHSQAGPQPSGLPQLPDVGQQGAPGWGEGQGGVTWPWSSGCLMASCAEGVGWSPQAAGYAEPRRLVLAPRAAPGQAEAAGPARRGGGSPARPLPPGLPGRATAGVRRGGAPCAPARPLRARALICGRGLPCTSGAQPPAPGLRPGVRPSASR